MRSDKSFETNVENLEDGVRAGLDALLAAENLLTLTDLYLSIFPEEKIAELQRDSRSIRDILYNETKDGLNRGTNKVYQEIKNIGNILRRSAEGKGR